MPADPARSEVTVRLCAVSAHPVRPEQPAPPGPRRGPVTRGRGDEGAAPDRRTEVVWALALLLVTAIGGLCFAHGSAPSWLDTMVPAALTSGRHSVLTDVTWLRYPQVVVAGSVVLAVVAFPRDRMRSLVCLVGPPLALATTELAIKPAVGRTLGAGFSYPSGSTVGAAALGVAAVLAAPAAWRGRTVVVASLYGLWMALAVVSLQWHYPTDAAAGLAYGCGVMLLLDAAVMTITEVLARHGLGRRHAPGPG